QAAGYAESDPSGDVEGLDAVNKLVILARLAFGGLLHPADVVNVPTDGPGAGRPGITGVGAADLAEARANGGVIKLIAEAVRGGAGAAPSASVLPRVVDAGSPPRRASGARRVAAAASRVERASAVLTGTEVGGEPVGTVACAGPGAGGAATSSAVLGDLIAIASDLGSTWARVPPAVAAVTR